MGECREPISRRQGNEFLNKLEDVGFSAGLAQRVIDSRGNILAGDLLRVVEAGGLNIIQQNFKAGYDANKFTFLKQFNLTIPANYNHANRLDTFKERYEKKFYGYNNNITDKNFAKVSHQLVPSKTYKVKIFGITERVTSEDCLNVYNANKAYYTGAQGASFVWEYKKNELIKEKWYCSFDEKDNLFVDSSCFRRVPRVSARSGGGFTFSLGCFECAWGGGSCLVVFCDE